MDPTLATIVGTLISSQTAHTEVTSESLWSVNLRKSTSLSSQGSAEEF